MKYLKTFESQKNPLEVIIKEIEKELYLFTDLGLYSYCTQENDFGKFVIPVWDFEEDYVFGNKYARARNRKRISNVIGISISSTLPTDINNGGDADDYDNPHYDIDDNYQGDVDDWFFTTSEELKDNIIQFISYISETYKDSLKYEHISYYGDDNNEVGKGMFFYRNPYLTTVDCKCYSIMIYFSIGKFSR